jgi:rhodanese-related sulfurtransferase
MTGTDIQTLSREELRDRLRSEQPENEDPRSGYALVNVLGEDAFREEHIPASINIPKGEEDEFERRFEKSKEIVVYCASPDCDASPSVARNLAERGFENVLDYEAGMSEWKDAGYPVEAGRAA